MARVLLVDHDNATRRRIRSLLVREGVDVCGEAADGKIAVEKVKQLRPDIVVLEYSLPKLNGIQAAYKMREVLPALKIVFFTFHDEALVSAAARVVGGSAFVSKSCFGALVIAVRRLIEHRGPFGLGAATITSRNLASRH